MDLDIDFFEPGAWVPANEYERRQYANQRPQCCDCFAFVSMEQARKSSGYDHNGEWDGPFCAAGKGCNRRPESPAPAHPDTAAGASVDSASGSPERNSDPQKQAPPAPNPVSQES